MDRLDEIIIKINSRDIMPTHWFKRNHRGYNVVCAVNNAIGLYLSNNLEDFFIDRVRTELDKVEITDDAKEYVSLAIKLTEELYKTLRAED